MLHLMSRVIQKMSVILGISFSKKEKGIWWAICLVKVCMVSGVHGILEAQSACNYILLWGGFSSGGLFKWTRLLHALCVQIFFLRTNRNLSGKIITVPGALAAQTSFKTVKKIKRAKSTGDHSGPQRQQIALIWWVCGNMKESYITVLYGLSAFHWLKYAKLSRLPTQLAKSTLSKIG